MGDFEAACGARYRKGTTLSISSDGTFADAIVPLRCEGVSSCPVPSISVLCVEDDHFQQEALIGLFALANAPGELYKVKIVGSAAEALSCLEAGFKPDLVLLDVMLDKGGESGDKLLPKMRAFFDEKENPSFIFASVLSHVERVKNLCALGVQGYLVKPIAPSTIKLMWQFCHPVAQPSNCPEQSPEQSLPSPSEHAADTSPLVGVLRNRMNVARDEGAAHRRATHLSPRLTMPIAANIQPSGAGQHLHASSISGHVYSRLRHANPAGTLRPIHMRPEDEGEVGACKQQ